MTIKAKVFTIGRSQALRWTAKLRLQAKEVRQEQIGGGIWLQPQVLPEHDMGKWLCQLYASTEALPDDFLADRHDAREFHRVPGLAVEEWAMD